MEALEIRDWAQLPPELLESIAARLTEIVDRVCFSSVCSQWRSASKSAAHSLPPQLPWLLLPKDTEVAGIVTTARCFFSLSRNRVFSSPLPECRVFPSPSGRILVAQGVESLALLNPLTLSSLTLPPLPLTECRRMNGGAFKLGKAKVFASDLVAVVFPDWDAIHFCRPGDSSWKSLYVNSYRDFAYHKGKFFALNGSTRTIWVFDADTLQKISEIPGLFLFRSCRIYLVESFAGDLLLVARSMYHGTRRFIMYQLDESKEKVKWMHIKSIGDNVLFVDGVQAMSFEATESNCWRRNCIYFVEAPTGPHRVMYHNPTGPHRVMVFNIGEDVIEELPLFSYTCFDRWKYALWVVPTLC